MREAASVVFDAIHLIQLPKAGDEKSDGLRSFIPYLSNAVAACSVGGLFFEMHSRPDWTLSDGLNALSLYQLSPLLDQLSDLQTWDAENPTIEMKTGYGLLGLIKSILSEILSHLFTV